MTDARRYRIELEELPDPDGVPGVIRLRHALKRLLRCYRLRCRSVEEVKAGVGFRPVAGSERPRHEPLRLADGECRFPPGADRADLRPPCTTHKLGAVDRWPMVARLDPHAQLKRQPACRNESRLDGDALKYDYMCIRRLDT